MKYHSAIVSVLYDYRFNVPGAGAYKPESTGQMGYYRHPAYSFGTRHRHRKSDHTPAANSYTLPGKQYPHSYTAAAVH